MTICHGFYSIFANLYIHYNTRDQLGKQVIGLV